MLIIKTEKKISVDILDLIRMVIYQSNQAGK
jgi:hypothetical protein